MWIDVMLMLRAVTAAIPGKMLHLTVGHLHNKKTLSQRKVMYRLMCDQDGQGTTMQVLAHAMVMFGEIN